ncbi:MAG: hypothetical protein WCG42_04000 [Parachlamydiaceae bacterium]
MDARSDYGERSPHLDAARSIVTEFIKENPHISSTDASTKERLIQIFSDNLLKKDDIKIGVDGFPKSISVSIHDFPEEMKVWATAKKTFTLSTLNVTGVAQHSSINLALSKYTIENQDWSDVQFVNQAHDGVRGAWFYGNEQRGVVVVKGQEDADQQLMGTVFLRCMGMNSPDSKMVARDSLEGKQLSSLGESYGLNDRNPTHYIVMSRVAGPSYKNLSSSEEHVDLVVKNLRDLGKLAVYDLVLGNFDRFQLNEVGFNAGNIMFEGGQLHAIDTDCVAVDEQRRLFTKLALKKIRKGNSTYADKISRSLSSNLGGGVDPKVFPSEIIQEGMVEALGKLIHITDNMEKHKQDFIDSCKERGNASSVFPDHLEEILLYIKDISVI